MEAHQSTTCEVSPAPAAPWAEAVETYGMDLAEATRMNRAGLPPSDVRWLRNAMAADTTGCTCGAVGSGATWANRRHNTEAAAECRRIAGELVAALQDVYLNRGDEGDHRWFAVVGPAPPGEPYSQLDDATVRAALGGALCPQLTLNPLPLDQYVAAYESTLRDHASYDHPNEIESYTQQHIAPYHAVQRIFTEAGCTHVTGFKPREIRVDRATGDACLQLTCVYPHLMLGLTQGGSVVGVAGLTVWT